jgi:hypothetical protein
MIECPSCHKMVAKHLIVHYPTTVVFAGGMVERLTYVACCHCYKEALITSYKIAIEKMQSEAPPQ